MLFIHPVPALSALDPESRSGVGAAASPPLSRSGVGSQTRGLPCWLLHQSLLSFIWYFRYFFYFPLPFYTKTVSHTPSISLEPWPRNAHGQTLSRLWSWTMPCGGGVNIYKERPPWNHGITRCLTADWEVLPRSPTPPLQDGSTYPLQLLGVLTPSKELPSAQRNPLPKSRPIPGVSHIQGWGAMTRSLPPIRIGEACAVTAHVCTTSPSAQSFPSSPQVGTQRALLWNLLEGRCSSQPEFQAAKTRGPVRDHSLRTFLNPGDHDHRASLKKQVDSRAGQERR